MSPLPPYEGKCDESLYSLIGTSGVTILFIISEILPFVKSVKSDGLIQAFARTFNFIKPAPTVKNDETLITTN